MKAPVFFTLSLLFVCVTVHAEEAMPAFDAGMEFAAENAAQAPEVEAEAPAEQPDDSAPTGEDEAEKDNVITLDRFRKP